MASPKDIPSERPSSHHGSGLASSMPARHSMSRNHSHSLSLGSYNPDHRITRRKSVNNHSISHAGASRAAGNGAEESGARSAHRRSMPAKSLSANRVSDLTTESKGAAGLSGKTAAVADESVGPDEVRLGQQPSGASKSRARRASEGAQLGGRRVSSELKCEKCGKGYKHSSCLTKHLWEHTPEWALTSKLLISKHQQVQLLEAASVLVGMNQDTVVEPSETVKAVESDNSSASPAASGSSGLPDDDGYSSAETTPPPMTDPYGMPDSVRNKRYSGNSSSFSRSYQSAPSNSLPTSNGFGTGAFTHSRPSTSGFGSADEEEASLVAAVQSLCSFGTPRNGPVYLPVDVPPVPPLPARFAEKGFQNADSMGAHGEAIGQAVTVHEVTDHDVEMEDDHGHGYRRSASSEAEDYDIGVFGGMEGLAHEHHETLSYTRST